MSVGGDATLSGLYLIVIKPEKVKNKHPSCMAEDSSRTDESEENDRN